jgi:hypothetical protein
MGTTPEVSSFNGGTIVVESNQTESKQNKTQNANATRLPALMEPKKGFKKSKEIIATPHHYSPITTAKRQSLEK